MHKYSYSKLWDLTFDKFQDNHIEYLKPSLLKDTTLNRHHNIYVYVYRIDEKKNQYYIKLIFDVVNHDLGFVSFHLTGSKDNRFKLLKG